jgi:putative transposase
VQTEPDAPVVGIDVGVANFLTTSTGKHYGTFHGKLRERQKRDREKRRRKAKLRKCLEKKGVGTLPSTRSKSGQRLIRHVRQEINRAVNQCFAGHPDAQIAWNAAKRGIQATRVKSAYSSQECSACHYPDRANRPNQRTFCCVICGFQTHADLNAATNIERRVRDAALQACKDKTAVKALLMQRHQTWKQQNGWP